jgi:hypothetical protein
VVHTVWEIDEPKLLRAKEEEEEEEEEEEVEEEEEEEIVGGDAQGTKEQGPQLSATILIVESHNPNPILFYLRLTVFTSSVHCFIQFFRKAGNQWNWT